MHLLPHGIGGAAVHKLKSVAWRPSDLAGYVPCKQLRHSLKMYHRCQVAPLLTAMTSSISRNRYLVLVQM